MEQRDLLKDQIEKAGRVLGKILSDFLGLKSKGNLTQGVEISNKRFQSELDIDIEKLLKLDKSDLKEYLSTRNLTEIHLEILSEYLTEVAKTKTVIAEQEPYLKKAIELFEIADEISGTISFERLNKRRKIENKLQQGV